MPNAHNPLMKFPRNMNCPCDSGKKFKKCCLPWMPRVIDSKLAEEYASAMDKPELIRFSFDSHIERGDTFKREEMNQTAPVAVQPENVNQSQPLLSMGLA